MNGKIKRSPAVSILPTFPGFEFRSSTVRRLCRLTRPGKKVEAQSTTSGPLGRLTLMVVPSRLNTLPWTGMRYSRLICRLYIGGKAALTRLHVLQTTPLVIIGREPLREDAKAYFAPEETRNLNSLFEESSRLSVGRMSSSPQATEASLSKRSHYH